MVCREVIPFLFFFYFCRSGFALKVRSFKLSSFRTEVRECHLNNEQPDIQAELVCSFIILLEIAEFQNKDI